jgi:hypothetical protein
MDSVNNRKTLQDTINLYSFILNLSDDKVFEIVRRMAVDFARLGVEPKEIHQLLDGLVKDRRY